MKNSSHRITQTQQSDKTNQSLKDECVTDISKRTGSDFCVDCGVRIDPKRRAALPFAIRCTACQQNREQKCR